MSQFMDDQTREEVRKALADMYAPVRLIYFTQEPAFGYCREQQLLLSEVCDLGASLSLEVLDWQQAVEKAGRFGIDKVPATVVLGQKDHGLRFFGLTAGYEFSSLIEVILMVAGGHAGLSPEVEQMARFIDVPVRLEVMVTLNCPYCPSMVRSVMQLAYVNDLIRAEMVEAGEFQILAQHYGVSGVPKTIINASPAQSFSGARSPAEAIMEILKLVKLEEYERLEAEARDRSGQRHVVAIRPDEVYDVLIVGAGPAALSAAVYAARKNLKVAIIGDHLGGQVTNTAIIENWPGLPTVGGQDLALMFRSHAERYAIAQLLRTSVELVSKENDLFKARTSAGEVYQARTVIFAAGKEYRRLGVEGEERFLGQGIGFCATCDAPLYKDRRVAVIGGANSAFTAARDLLPFASEIHLIYRGQNFRADPQLVEDVSRVEKVKLHTGLNVAAFLGEGRLRGLKLVDAAGDAQGELAVDGVFLEIGLEPNSAAVRDLVRLNAAGEVPVGRDQATDVAGLFAAGDVTDEPDKQIIIAAAAGAKAALSAYRYLVDRRLVLISSLPY
ncbi:MAG: Alkyl hydroperoxide reductase subunit F [Deltaproteobacteria bacterium ADurb.Bin510]|nr:MAG: Alkyl hydroperoxide reductase subunit F [Deltaproteobacteria bacterium ADurb.Bin510]